MQSPTTILKASALFGGLAREQIGELAAAAEIRSLFGPDDDLLFVRGEPAETVYLVLPDADTGPALQISFDDPGAVAPRFGYRLFGGELAGDPEFLLAGLGPQLPRRIATARALRPVRVLGLPAGVLSRLVEAEPALRRRLIREAARRLAQPLASRGQGAALPDIAFARALLDLIDDFGTTAGDTAGLAVPMAQQTIADRLGMSLRALTLRLSAWSARGLVRTHPFALPALSRVERIAECGRQGAAEALEAAMAAATDCLRRGDTVRASQIAADILVLFPGNPALLHVLALAAARDGATGRAAAILADAGLGWTEAIPDLRTRLAAAWTASAAAMLQSGGGDALEQEEAMATAWQRIAAQLTVDIAALHARLRKETVFDRPVAERAAPAEAAAGLYLAVQSALPNAYCAVNAATLSVVAGAPEQARDLATAALRLAADPADPWQQITRAEALLVLGRDATAELARAARQLGPAELGVARRQFGLLRDAGLAGAAPALALIDPGAPLGFSGAILRSRDAPPAELDAAIAAIRADLSAWLAGRRVPLAVCGLSAGCDILFAEAVLEAGIPLRLVLPFDPERVMAASVRITGDAARDADWQARARTFLEQAAEVTVLWPQEPRKSALDAHFRWANQHIAGEIVMAGRIFGTRPLLLTLTDGGSGAVGGTADMTAAFRALGHEVCALPLPLARPRPAAAAVPARAVASGFAAVVFAFATSAEDGPAAARVMQEAGFAPRRLRDRRAGGLWIAPGFAEAAAFARRSLAAAAAAGVGLRLICDYGPALLRDGTPDPEAVPALPAAADLTAASPEDVHASAGFAMAAIATGALPPAGLAAISVGRPGAGPAQRGPAAGERIFLLR